MSDNPLVHALKEVCLFLDGGGTEYALVGGLAVGIWAEPRATVDIDFLVALSLKDSDALLTRVRESGQFIFIHDKPMMFNKISLLRATLKSNPDISVDFLFAGDAFKQEALKRKLTVDVAGLSVNIPTPEDLILLKRLSGRPQDIVDADKITAARKNDIDMDYLRRWAGRLGIIL